MFCFIPQYVRRTRFRKCRGHVWKQETPGPWFCHWNFAKEAYQLGNSTFLDRLRYDLLETLVVRSHLQHRMGKVTELPSMRGLQKAKQPQFAVTENRVFRISKAKLGESSIIIESLTVFQRSQTPQWSCTWQPWSWRRIETPKQSKRRQWMHQYLWKTRRFQYWKLQRVQHWQYKL